MPDEIINVISQLGFYFDLPNLQDSFNMALSRRVFMGHIGPHLHAHLGHNYCQMSLLI